MTPRALYVVASVAARKTLAERGSLLFTAGLYLIVTATLGALWRAATGATGGEVVGYGAVALTWYVATAEAGTVSLNARLIDQFGDEVASGAFAVDLLRPVSAVGVRIAAELGRALPRIAVCATAGTALSLLTAGPPPDTAALLLAAPALLLGVTCNLTAMHAFAASAFWLRETRATWFLYQKLVFVVGGMLLPIEVLPDAVANVARVLPFVTMAYVPARLASGHFEPELMLLQVGWLVALAGLAAWVFRAGERRLQVVGG